MNEVTWTLTLPMVAMIADAVAAKRRVLLWTLDSLHATPDEKDAARAALVECNRLLSATQRHL